MTKRSSSSSRSKSSSSRSRSRSSRSGASRSRTSGSRRSSSSRSRSSSSRSKSKPKPQQPSLWENMSHDQKLDILGWALFVLAGFTLLAMLSERGTLTELWIDLLSMAFGWGRFIMPLLLGALGLWLIVRNFGDKVPKLDPEQIVGIVLGFFVATTTFHVYARQHWMGIDLYDLAKDGLGGGYTGAFLLDRGITLLGVTGVIFTLIIGWILVITFTLSLSPAEIIEKIAEWRAARIEKRELAESTMHASMPEQLRPEPRPRRRRRQAKVLGQDETLPEEAIPPVPEAPPEGTTGLDPESILASKPTINRNGRPVASESGINIPQPAVGTQTWRLPSAMDILEEGSDQTYSEALIRKQYDIIEKTLQSLGAPALVREVNQGPVITQFGIEPQFLTNRSGKKTKIKVSKIASLADDLSLALSARSIRIQAPIPGKGLVGIEVPNEESAVVSLRDVMESPRFSKLKGRMRLGLGQDVSGQAVATDMRSLPHLLVAGATGAGKSVCVNSIIAALLLQNSPDTLRLILVDPKRVELTQYNGIPHLLAPVIVDVENVVPALRWVTKEMDSRYRRFASIGARNIEDYNERVANDEDHERIPYIAIIIDELADMMMQAPEETERVICRLAQMARATGIHLIIATQRPSVDVVTGLIKANFPARIAFAVASSIDSRVILDTPGAERLLGRGDMLFMPPDVAQPLRLQGAFVSDKELDRLIAYWRNAVDPSTNVETRLTNQQGPSLQQAASQPALFPSFDEPAGAGAVKIEDNIMPAAVEVFLSENRASTSLLQRKLRIGYTRAARLVDQLTEIGVITEERQGQFRKVNRSVGEELLRSIYGDDGSSA